MPNTQHLLTSIRISILTYIHAFLQYTLEASFLFFDLSGRLESLNLNRIYYTFQNAPLSQLEMGWQILLCTLRFVSSYWFKIFLIFFNAA